MEIRIGTSGWNYRHWRGIFYPKKLPTRKWLSYYSQYFDTVEVNSTFYGTPKKETLARWLEETPEGFLFAVKASRFITHLKRLKAVGEALERFFESLSPLYPKLGVILFQLPPSLKYEPELMEEFLSLIPRDFSVTLEIRNSSFHNRDFLRQLERYGVALCLSDTAGRYPSLLEVITADFTYIRLHGSRSLYRSCYTQEELSAWAEKIRAFSVQKVYVYFDNDSLGWAPENALRLKSLLGFATRALPEEVFKTLSRRPLE
ncbi:DUF72 domain-containing protein [Thermosulfurimonas dismutans]|uniref:DUF72 domain-containing protein n=1 Tax=Thermosulfurimonas dismutans TaxID=999894 RepID=A0A179D2M7_9BACT|nr:DUF72 domain-containing protein [Thermosulfurimonas dismutans]OAQ20325.1 hypothetical protein TDIS_1520 [Thermosulfurimonas dismutans]